MIFFSEHHHFATSSLCNKYNSIEPPLRSNLYHPKLISISYFTCAKQRQNPTQRSTIRHETSLSKEQQDSTRSSIPCYLDPQSGLSRSSLEPCKPAQSYSNQSINTCSFPVGPWVVGLHILAVIRRYLRLGRPLRAKTVGVGCMRVGDDVFEACRLNYRRQFELHSGCTVSEVCDLVVLLMLIYPDLDFLHQVL
jgi:hypothetical protein